MSTNLRSGRQFGPAAWVVLGGLVCCLLTVGPVTAAQSPDQESPAASEAAAAQPSTTDSAEAPASQPTDGSESQPAEPSDTDAGEVSETESAEPSQTEDAEPSTAEAEAIPATESTQPSQVDQAGASEAEAAQPSQTKPSEMAEDEPAGSSEAQPPESAQGKVLGPPPAEPPSPPQAEPRQPSEAQPAGEPPAEMDEAWLRSLFEGEDRPSPQPPQGMRPEGPAKGPVLLTFSWRYVPWEDVLEWFAEHAGLSLVFQSMPKGTCNYVDPHREYTVAEAMDVLNSLLLMKGYTLVRRHQVLIVVNLEDPEDPIPEDFVTTVLLEELDQRGEYELVAVHFQLEKVTTEEAEQEIQKLIGPTGSISAFPMARQLKITETGGRLRTIRKVIERMEGTDAASTEAPQAFPLEFVSAEQALPVLRQLLGVSEEENATSDGSLRFAADPLGTRILATGQPDKLEQVAKILETINVPGAGDLATEGVQQALQVEVYPVAPADPETARKVMETLLEGLPGVRLSTDPKTGNLIVRGPLDVHATVQATLEQLRSEANRIEVIPLRTLDPEAAVVAITNLFGGEGSTLKVDADPTMRRLIVVATDREIEQIRAWLVKMGETGTAEYAPASRGNVRMLPVTGRAARSALERLQQIWPAIRPNTTIRVVTPSAVVPELRRITPAAPPSFDQPLLDERFGPRSPAAPALEEPPAKRLDAAAPADEPPPVSEPPPPLAEKAPPPEASPAETRIPEGQTTAAAPAASGWARVLLASQTVEADSDTEDRDPKEPPPEPDSPNLPPEPPAIIVAAGPGGIMIASQDTEALDALENLLNTLISGAMSDADVTVFYLKYAQASVVAGTLSQILATGSTFTRSGPGGPSRTPQGSDSGVPDSLLSLGSSIAPSGPVQINSDERLNALLVQGNPADIDRIERLLMILDQPESPEEVMIQPRPQRIQVFYMPAEEVAEIVQDLYQDRMITGSGRSRGGFDPRQMMEMMAQARGGPGSSGRRGTTSQQTQRLSIAVDARTNSLIVSAPDSLYREVEQLVRELDQAAADEPDQTIQIVKLDRMKPELAQQAIQTVLGESVSSGRTSSSSRRSSSGSSSSFDDMRRMMMLRGGFGAGPPGFGGRGGPPSGFGDRGGPSSRYSGRGGSSGGRSGGSSGRR